MTNDDFPERRGAHCAARMTILSLMEGNKNPHIIILNLKNVCVSVSHQECLFYVDWGIRWGTIHSPRGLLQDVWTWQADLTGHYKVDTFLTGLETIERQK